MLGCGAFLGAANVAGSVEEGVHDGEVVVNVYDAGGYKYPCIIYTVVEVVE